MSHNFCIGKIRRNSIGTTFVLSKEKDTWKRQTSSHWWEILSKRPSQRTSGLRISAWERKPLKLCEKKKKHWWELLIRLLPILPIGHYSYFASCEKGFISEVWVMKKDIFPILFWHSWKYFRFLEYTALTLKESLGVTDRSKKFRNESFDKHMIYSASMKSYHFWNFDILEIIKGIWTVTLHFVFLVNYRHA